MAGKSAFQIQRESIEKYREIDQKLLWRPRIPREEELLEAVGITGLPEDRQLGMVKLFPFDFIVEEKRYDGRAVGVEPEPFKIEEKAEKSHTTLFFDLVKMNITQVNAVRQLADAIGVRANEIGFAGIKDKKAITAQRACIRNPKPEVIEKMKKLNERGIYVKNLSWGEGFLAAGDHAGNRFTIFVRTKEPPYQEEIIENMARVEARGFINYYHLQRFGNTRLNTHVVGMHLYRGDFRQAVLSYMTHPTEFEINILQQKRAQAAKDFPNFEKIYRSFSELPYSFNTELRLLEHLRKKPGDYIGALLHIGQITKICIQGYASYLFNLSISEQVTRRRHVPFEQVMATGEKPIVYKLYGKWMRKHGTEKFLRNLSQLRGLYNPRLSFRKVRIKAKVHKVAIVPEGLLFSFELPSGTYATAFLNNFFRLYASDRKPVWANPQKYDIKATLGLGSTKQAMDNVLSIQKEQEEIEETTLETDQENQVDAIVRAADEKMATESMDQV